jgi:outer membrane protein
LIFQELPFVFFSTLGTLPFGNTTLKKAGHLLLSVCALLFPLEAFPAEEKAATQPPLSLRAAFEQAQENDNAFAAAQKRALASREAVPMARANLLPSVSAYASTSRVHRETPGMLGMVEREYTQDSHGLQLRQPLINIDRVLRLSMARKESEIGGYELELARQDLIRRVIEAYFTLLLAQEQVSLSQAELKAIEAQKHQAEKMREGGIATLTDVHEAQARFDRARAQEIEARNALQISRRAMAKIMGTAPGDVLPLGARAQYHPPEPLEPEVWVELALSQAFEVRLRQTAFERMQSNQQRAQSQHLPTLDMVAAYQKSSNTDQGYATDKSARIGVELNIPLYQGGRITAESREAAHRRDQAEEEWLLARRHAELEATTGYSELTNAIARIHALEQAVRSGETALKAAEISFSVAYRTFVDVLNAQQLLYRSRFDLLRARFDYIKALVRLNAAVGALDESLVQDINDWLDTDGPRS